MLKYPDKVAKARIKVVFFLLIIFILIMEVRLIWIQLIKGETYETMAYDNRFKSITLEASRGTIYDANGNVLAISVITDSFYANPQKVVKSDDIDNIVNTLAEAFDLDAISLRAKITDTSKSFVYIKRQVDQEISAPIKALKLTGIYTLQEPKRTYPKDYLAANILGFVGTDNEGLSGIEASYNSILAGKSGLLMVEQDTSGNAITDAAEKYIEPVQGSSIKLTIDETIQYICERELSNLIVNYEPQKAGIIVMRPTTGEVLAMAEYPSFDPNDFGDYPSDNWKNHTISDVYEPGSIFKPFVLAAALEEGTINKTDTFYCGGAIEVEGGRIKCWKIGSHGEQTLMEAVQNSCNPAFITIGASLGKNTFYKYIKGFGFGQKTNIELTGEAAGILQNQAGVAPLDVAAMSIGQSIAVTPLQMVTAFSAIANGGYLMKPIIVKERLDDTGNVIESYEPEIVRQVISEDTSRYVLDALETVVSVGTGKAAYIKGYRVGGKTGTAQKADSENGGYSENDYIASFLGVAPVDDPQIVMLVYCDTPSTEVHSGSAVSAPVFQAAASDILKYLEVTAQVEPSDFTGGYKSNVTVPDVSGLSVNDAKQKALNAGLSISVVGTGNTVIAQLPLANTKVTTGGSIVLYTKLPPTTESITQVAVPELTGKTEEEIRIIESSYNLNFEITGEGNCIYQNPSPGALVNAGTTINVSLEPKITDQKAIDLAAP